MNGTDSYDGRVEICLYGTWKTVCRIFWDRYDAEVVCAQLGYPSEGNGVELDISLKSGYSNSLIKQVQ